jgi:hypothetical protein
MNKDSCTKKTMADNSSFCKKLELLKTFSACDVCQL